MQRADCAAVRWRDLVEMSRGEKIMELMVSLPWLGISFAAYANGWFVCGAVASFYFFLTGLRQSHGAQHYSMGIARRWQEVVLWVLSGLMLTSMHAVQASHLHHHRHCLDADDSEGMTARLKWWQAILVGPLFVMRLHRKAWELGNARQRRWITVEVATAALVLMAAAAGPDFLKLHCAAMIAGECLTGFFAVWTVHHDCDRDTMARTQRGRWLSFLSYNMFFHAEHHLYPSVPTCHLDELARRLDAVSGEPARQVMRV